MKKLGLNELRELFLSFFESKDHLRLPSFSLIPQNDNSLLIINSGMAPMKPYFKGEQEPPRHRICTCQKCIRTGDIENIGKTSRHGTYFEMLGNFSFGDYFKHEAIAWSWEFLTSPQWVGLDPDRLYPSVYQDDDEAWNIWHDEIGIPAERIFRFGKEDNFWEHGAGPCGPCSEIYYDRGEKYGCGKPGCTVGCDCDRYMEVWNNVFSQFDNDGHNNYTELIQKNIDTGMGLERLAVVCQDVDSLFDVDTVMNITNRVSELTGAYYGKNHKTDVSLRVITDHIRSAVFMISDGILPSNNGRGYVLRRLLRRAARHGKLLGMNEPFLYNVVDMVVHENECQYPELREKEKFIITVIKSEEDTFAKTIDAGLNIFAEMLRKGGGSEFSGEDAFKLYDTYGFPLDLTEDMCDEQGIALDKDGFARCMEEQKTKAREARKALGDLGWAGIDFGKEMPETVFEGYDRDVTESKILAIVVDEEFAGSVDEGKEAIIVLDRTTMYAEMGGQVADHGTIVCGDGVFEVSNVQKNKGGKFMHYGVMKSGELELGDTVTVSIDVERRKAIRRAHSATHLLQAALVKVLGDHVHQAGSLVEPDHLRFDFTHFSALTAEELNEVDNIIEHMTLDGDDIETLVLPIEEAKKMGATALFGEKYGDVVRVVKMGDKSVEFCGGTHADNTAKIGMIAIVSEGSVASGVRRIEAYTGLESIHYYDNIYRLIEEAAEMLKTRPSDLLSKIEANVEEARELKQALAGARDTIISGQAENIMLNSKEVSGLKVITYTDSSMNIDELRQLGDKIRDRYDNVVAVLSTVNTEKGTIVAVCSKKANTAGIRAGDLVKFVCSQCGGSGGGKPESAMGGCKDVMRLDNALATVDEYIFEHAKQ